MNKEPTATIYSCLTESFWTQRKCQSCQKFFTSNKNYQLSFLEVLTTRTDIDNCLEVIVKLQHRFCPLSWSYQKDTICEQEIKK